MDDLFVAVAHINHRSCLHLPMKNVSGFGLYKAKLTIKLDSAEMFAQSISNRNIYKLLKALPSQEWYFLSVIVLANNMVILRGLYVNELRITRNLLISIQSKSKNLWK